MSEIEDIKQDIADTKAELTDAKRKLAEAVVDKNQSEIEEWKARRNTLEALLLVLMNSRIEQQKKENILLVSQGKFTLLSLLIAFKNLLNSTFLIHMMTDNALFHFLSASVAAPVPTGKL